MNDEAGRKRQGIMALIGGILLIIAGLHTNIFDVSRLIWVAVNEGILTPPIASIIIAILRILGFLAGIPVILGGLLHYYNKSKLIANALISFGSGISIMDLFSFMIATGPAVKAYILTTKAQEISNISVFYLIVILGLSFSFLALFIDPMGMILGLVSAIITSIAGSIIEVVLITAFLAKIGLIHPSPLEINVMKILFLSGVIFLVGGYLAGIGKYKLAYVITMIALLIYLLPIIVLITGILTGHVFPVRLVLSVIGEITGLVLLIHIKTSLKK